MPEAEAFRRRLAGIRSRIEAAARKVDRSPADVTLVAVSKGQSTERVAWAWEAGLRVFGENRVQEAEEKARELPAELEWHLIGPLQSNKVRKAVALFHQIHSVDRPKIALALDREAGLAGRRLGCFLEVHLGEEETKHGFEAAGLPAAVRPLADLAHIRWLGLMTIPPPSDDATSARRWFRRLRQLRDELWSQPWWPATTPGFLSMGMSADFEEAILEGATHVRVGTDLFGPRNPAP
jgi:pyridoxal phosphate enzyme (YggS family)